MIIDAISKTERSTNRRIRTDLPCLLFLVLGFSQWIVATSGKAQTAPEGKKTKTPAEAAASYFPNNVLLTQDNTRVHFFEDLLKGKTVLINFFFTTCTGVCPPM